MNKADGEGAMWGLYFRGALLLVLFLVVFHFHSRWITAAYWLTFRAVRSISSSEQLTDGASCCCCWCAILICYFILFFWIWRIAAADSSHAERGGERRNANKTVNGGRGQNNGERNRVEKERPQDFTAILDLYALYRDLRFIRSKWQMPQ